MLIGRLSSSATTVATRNGQNLDYIIFIYSTYTLPALNGEKRRGSMLHNLLKTQLGYVSSTRCVLAQCISDVLDRNLVGLS